MYESGVSTMAKMIVIFSVPFFIHNLYRQSEAHDDMLGMYYVSQARVRDIHYEISACMASQLHRSQYSHQIIRLSQVQYNL